MTTFSTQLYHVHFFHATALCLLFSMLLNYVYFFYAAALCLLYPSCCAMTTLTTLLYDTYFFHAAAVCLLFPLYVATCSPMGRWKQDFEQDILKFNVYSTDTKHFLCLFKTYLLTRQ